MSVPSPCISICSMREDYARILKLKSSKGRGGVCEGCLRTLDEITDWGLAPDAYKTAVWQAIEERATVLNMPAPQRTA